ncbi:hypothetical protein U8P80_30935 (plasmid) [Rhizobium beringeri]|nr:hypothetical protein U8P80_30935 [Rhizobium beringeri]WSH17577.1 hypothetical protein U8P74_30935 [Rhizobium beringeri]
MNKFGQLFLRAIQIEEIRSQWFKGETGWHRHIAFNSDDRGQIVKPGEGRCPGKKVLKVSREPFIYDMGVAASRNITKPEPFRGPEGKNKPAVRRKRGEEILANLPESACIARC